MQESCGKDVERAFGVLHARCVVLRDPAFGWAQNHLGERMTACIITHNIFVEDKGPRASNVEFAAIGVHVDLSSQSLKFRTEWLCSHHNITSRKWYNQLQHDLIEHLWTWRGAIGVKPMWSYVIFYDVVLYLFRVPLCLVPSTYEFYFIMSKSSLCLF